MAKKKTTKQFIEGAVAIHEDRYDYSKSVYLGRHSNIEIICKDHGSFWQDASVHLRGFGCSQCSGVKKITIEEFIIKALKVHSNKYDYKKSIYINNTTKLEIICDNHGSFWQTPNNHISRKSGCSKCAGIEKSTIDEFIVKAIKIHGNIYNYSNAIYNGNKKKLEIICQVHGSFFQIPNNHLSGDGCPDCFGKKKFTTEEFVEISQEIHGNKYDYSKVEYIDSTTNVVIICLIHGEFKTIPANHIHSCSGCPKCTKFNEGLVAKFINNYSFVNERVTIKSSEFKCYPDFYLPEFNLFIEYNGLQHYEPVTFGNQTKENAEKNFIRQQKRDEFVRQYCYDNGYLLWEINGRKYKGKKLYKLLEEKFIKLKAIKFMGKGVI